VGRTSFNTPIRVNAQVAAADLLVGIGGVYPQHTTGFGGGSKLILGVLGRETIARLHYGHPSGQGSYRVDNDFRADLDEIAARLGFRTAVSVHVDERRRIVRAVSGDHLAYYPEAVRYAIDTFAAPLPGDADVVVSNAYPMDTSLTFMRSKGMTPFDHAKPGASRLVVAGCAEGVGHHGLFPYRNRAPGPAIKHHARRLRAQPSRAPAMVRSAMARAVRAGRGSPAEPGEDPSPPPLLYATAGAPALPQGVTRLVPHDDWHAVLDAIDAQQSGRDGLRVALYACAPLQVLLP
jgi:nickel-dependent lactate racemase